MADDEEPTAEDEARAESIMHVAHDLTLRMSEAGLRPADLFWLMAAIVHEMSAGTDEEPTGEALRAAMTAIGRRVALMRKCGVMESLASIDQAEAIFNDVMGPGTEPHFPAPSKAAHGRELNAS
jgi:hypothetical protein